MAVNQAVEIYQCIQQYGPITVDELRLRTEYIHYVLETAIRVLRERGLVVQYDVTTAGEPRYVSSRPKESEQVL